MPRLPALLQAQLTATRILVTGDRKWDDYITMFLELSKCRAMQVLIHGDCDGADKMAGRIGEELIGTENVIRCPANWGKFGRSAGPIRNRAMLRDHPPNFVLAFHNNIEKSKGTKDMINVARKAGIPVKLVTSS